MPNVLPLTEPAPPTDKGNPGGYVHIPALDGIRGLAIALVLLHHLLAANDVVSSRILTLITQIRESAFIGVNLFFALSGFLITGILLDTVDIPHYFRTFYARRALRIFPLYYGTLFVLLLLTHPMHLNWNGWEYFYLTYTSNLALWRHSFPSLEPFNVRHYWSLQVEEQFYFIWPLIVLRVRRPETLVRICAIGALVVLAIRIFIVSMYAHPAFQDPYLAYQPTFSCADNLLFGCGLCALLRSRWRTAATRLAPRVFAVTAVAIVTMFIAFHGISFMAKDGFFSPTFGMTIVGLCCASVIAMTLESDSYATAFFSSRFLRFLGKYSYGIYIFHYSIGGILDTRLRRFFNLEFHSKALSIGLTALIVFSLSILVALISYHLYEIQFLKLKRFFGYNRSAKTAAISEPA